MMVDTILAVFSLMSTGFAIFPLPLASLFEWGISK